MFTGWDACSIFIFSLILFYFDLEYSCRIIYLHNLTSTFVHYVKEINKNLIASYLFADAASLNLWLLQGSCGELSVDP